jgi:hypothetical protein
MLFMHDNERRWSMRVGGITLVAALAGACGGGGGDGGSAIAEADFPKKP